MSKSAIYVLAGVNGAGKSSIGGAAIKAFGVDYYNPDIVAKRLRELHPEISQVVANSLAWKLGKEMLEKAIFRRQIYAFETTLGGTTITNLLIEAAKKGIPIRVWYVGLETVEMNIRRVKARVEQGGHDISELDIRRRWDSSRRNLIKLLPFLDSLRIYDNSYEANLLGGVPPKPRLLLHMDRKTVLKMSVPVVPDWAKPIVAGALNLYDRSP